MQGGFMAGGGVEGGAAAGLQGQGTRSPWFDEDGLMACLPNPTLPR